MKKTLIMVVTLAALCSSAFATGKPNPNNPNLQTGGNGNGNNGCGNGNGGNDGSKCGGTTTVGGGSGGHGGNGGTSNVNTNIQNKNHNANTATAKASAEQQQGQLQGQQQSIANSGNSKVSVSTQGTVGSVSGGTSSSASTSAGGSVGDVSGGTSASTSSVGAISIDARTINPDNTAAAKVAADADVEVARINGQTARDVANTTVKIKNTPSVSGPALTASNDTCMGSTSGSINIAGLGIGGGTSWVDTNCKMLKNSRELWNMGMRAAALARMCMDSDNREALELTGFTCPQTEKAKSAAKTVHHAASFSENN